MVVTKGEKMITDHKWYCDGCSKTWFLAVDMEDDQDVIKLVKFQTAISIHAMESNHTVIHKEKDRKISIRYG